MPRQSHNKIGSNPISLNDEKTKNLDEAYGLFLETLEEYSSKHNLSQDLKESLKKEVSTAYMEKKASYWLQSRVTGFANFLSRALNGNGGAPENEPEGDTTSMVYYKNKRRLINHEQPV